MEAILGTQYSHDVGVDVDLRLVGGLAVRVDGHTLVLAGILLDAALVYLQRGLLADVSDGRCLSGLQLLAVPTGGHSNMSEKSKVMGYCVDACLL